MLVSVQLLDALLSSNNSDAATSSSERVHTSTTGSEACTTGSHSSGQGHEAGVHSLQLHLQAQQLQAITAVTLFQIWSWVGSCTLKLSAMRRANPCWLANALHACKQLNDLGLQLPMTSLLQRTAIPKRVPSVVFQPYAEAHLYGRLLPGCCHLGCTNMDGSSEAALETLLCSRCRRARYCSLECERSAWVNEDHKDLCGKQL